MFRSFLITTFFLSILLASGLFSNQVYLTLIKEIPLDDIPRDIVLYNDKAFIMTSGALYSVSAVDPNNPELTTYDGLETSYSIAFTSRFVYAVGGYDGIKYFDLTKSPPEYKSKVITSGAISKIIINNGYMFVVNNSFGLQVYDVNITDFPLFKNTQILPGNASGIFMKDNKAYVTSTNAHLYIIDANDISKLPIVGSYNYGTGFYEPYVTGDYAFIPQGSTGVQVLNITKLPFPEFVTNIFARKSAKQVVASNFYIWVADEYSVEGFFNISEKSFLFAGNYKNGDAVINRILEIDGKYIYVCSNDKKLKILRIDYKY